MIWIYFLLLVVIIVAILMSVTLITFAITKVPFVSLRKKKVATILRLVKLDKNKVLYDLGCGDARVLIKAYNKYNTRGIGYELNWWAFLRAKINILIHNSDVQVYNKNFFNIDLTSADYIFVYLIPVSMLKLEKKILEKPQSTRQIISYAFKFPTIKPDKILYTEDCQNRGKIYIYNI